MAGGLFPTRDLPLPSLPSPVLQLPVSVRATLVSAPVASGEAPSAFRFGVFLLITRRRERRGGCPKFSRLGFQPPIGRSAPLSGPHRPLVVPRLPALTSGSYWPKVSAPSGKLAPHWPAPGHVTPLWVWEPGKAATSSAEGWRGSRTR